MGVPTEGTSGLARLDKSGNRVLCTHPLCRGELAKIVSVPWEFLQSRIGLELHNGWPLDIRAEMMQEWQECFEGEPFPEDVRLLVFQDGWTRSPEGIWYYSERARQQTKKGHRPTRRTPRNRGPGAIVHMQEHFRANAVRTDWNVLLPEGLTRARCPNQGCRRLQILDPDCLNLFIYAMWPIVLALWDCKEEQRSANLNATE